MNIFKIIWFIGCFWLGFMLTYYYYPLRQSPRFNIQCQEGYQVIYDKEGVPTLLYDKLGEPIRCLK